MTSFGARLVPNGKPTSHLESTQMNLHGLPIQQKNIGSIGRSTALKPSAVHTSTTMRSFGASPVAFKLQAEAQLDTAAAGMLQELQDKLKELHGAMLQEETLLQNYHQMFHDAVERWTKALKKGTSQLGLELEGIKSMECLIVNSGLGHLIGERAKEWVAPPPLATTKIAAACSEGACRADVPLRQFPCATGISIVEYWMDHWQVPAPPSPVSGSKRQREVEDDAVVASESPRKSPRLSEDSPRKPLHVDENFDPNEADIPTLRAQIADYEQRIADLEQQCMLFKEKNNPMLVALQSEQRKKNGAILEAAAEYARLYKIVRENGLEDLLIGGSGNDEHAIICHEDSTGSVHVKMELDGADSSAAGAAAPKAARPSPAGSKKKKTRRGGNVRRAWQQVTGALGKFGRTLLGCGNKVFEGMDESDGEVIRPMRTTGVVDMAV